MATRVHLGQETSFFCIMACTKHVQIGYPHSWAVRLTVCGALHNPLHARAGGRASFSLTAKPFNPKQKGKGEHTF